MMMDNLDFYLDKREVAPPDVGENEDSKKDKDIKE